MLLIWILGLVTIALSGSAEFFSVYGLAQVFSAAFSATIIMGAALGAAKLIIASFLYTHWKRVNILFKSALIFIILGLMGLTSLGIFGFLSAAYQTDSVDFKVVDQQVTQLNEEKSSYEHRLSDIDTQIQNVPSTKVRQKIQLINSLNKEKQDILDKLDTTTKTRDSLTSQKLKTEVKTGPIAFVAKAINKPIDVAVTYLIFIIMILLDPSAVALTVATNMAIRFKREDKQSVLKPEVQSTIAPTIAPIILDVPLNEPVQDSIPLSESKDSDTKVILQRLDDIQDNMNKKSEIIKSIRNTSD